MTDARVVVSEEKTIVHEVKLRGYEVDDFSEEGLKNLAIEHLKSDENELRHGVSASSTQIEGASDYDAEVDR